jgi:hypothetical protein
VQKAIWKKEVQIQVTGATTYPTVNAILPKQFIVYTPEEKAIYKAKMEEKKRSLTSTGSTENPDAKRPKYTQVPQVSEERLPGKYVEDSLWHENMPSLAEGEIWPSWKEFPTVPMKYNASAHSNNVDAYNFFFPDVPIKVANKCNVTAQTKWKQDKSIKFCLLHHSYKHATINCPTLKALYPGTAGVYPTQHNLPPVPPTATHAPP